MTSDQSATLQRAVEDALRRGINLDRMGVTYCLHFTPAYKQAQHYIGRTKRGCGTRIVEHISGQASPLVRAAVEAGCSVTIHIVGTYADESRIKRQHNNWRYCPDCRAERQARGQAVRRLRLEAGPEGQEDPGA